MENLIFNLETQSYGTIIDSNITNSINKQF